MKPTNSIQEQVKSIKVLVENLLGYTVPWKAVKKDKIHKWITRLDRTIVDEETLKLLQVGLEILGYKVTWYHPMLPCITIADNGFVVLVLVGY